MATVRYKVFFHSEVNGKFDAQFGHRVALISASDTLDTSGSSRPSPANISAALSNNSLHNSKGGAVIVLDNIANLDPPSAPTFS
jgi:hypothetical protein